MPIYRCNDCSFVSEEALAPIGCKLPCARCDTASTVFYVKKLVERYFSALREIKTRQ